MLRVVERKFHRRFSKNIQCDISNVIVFSVSIKGSRTLIALGRIQQTEDERSRLLRAPTFRANIRTYRDDHTLRCLLTLNFQISRSIYNRFGYSRGAFAIPNDLFQRSLSCTVKFQPPVVMRSFSAIGPAFLA